MSPQRFAVHLLTLLACGIILGAMLSLPPVMSANDASRWDTVWSLNAGQGYAIDNAPYETCDKVIRGGRFYSSKPALMPAVLAGLAWIIQRAVGLALPRNDDSVVRLILILINVLPFALMIELYARLLERLGYGFPTRLFCLGAAAFGTYLTSYSVSLNNHTLAACATFFALYCWVRVECDGQRRRRYFFLAGLCAAWAAANEMPAVLFAAVLFAAFLRLNARRAFFCFLPPALAMAAAFFCATYLAAGSLLPYTFNPEPSLGAYANSPWINPVGIDALQEPKWLYMFNMLLGHHGILSLTPVFVFAFYGAFLKAKLQAINRIGLALTVCVFLAYTLRTANYGGRCQGMRWLFWLIPFWLISLAPAVDKGFGSRLFRALAFAALFVSLLSVGFALSAGGSYGAAGPWGFSWLHQLMASRKWAAH